MVRPVSMHSARAIPVARGTGSDLTNRAPAPAWPVGITKNCQDIRTRRAAVKSKRCGLNAVEIGESVPMLALLAALGIQVSASRRTQCPVHGGENPTSFSWRENGYWQCFSCGRHGDKISLVREVRQCTFQEAMRFLASLAGLDLQHLTLPLRESSEVRKERKRLERAAEFLLHVETQALISWRGEIHRLERVRRYAAKRISALASGARERFPKEADCAWTALAIVADELPGVAAGYSLLALGTRRARFRFVVCPEARRAMSDSILYRGGVLREGRRFWGLLPL